MPQLSWTYSDTAGQQFNIGLYHGLKSGHVIVYCNKSIVLIDFSILDNKKYSFFIGEEFIELDLEKDRSDKKFSYNLKINKEANTSLNRIRKLSNKKDNIIAACLRLAFFITIGLTCYLIFTI